MLPVILNIHTTKSSLSQFELYKTGASKMHIYIPLPSQDVADKATTWLEKFQFMNAFCDIKTHDGRKAIHFKPYAELPGAPSAGAQPYPKLQKANGFAISFGIARDKTETKLLTDSATAFVQILDNSLSQKTYTYLGALTDDLKKSNHHFQIDLKVTGELLITFANNFEIFSDTPPVAPGHFPVHITDDIKNVLNEALQSIKPYLSAPKPADDNTATEASSAAPDKAMTTYLFEEVTRLTKSVREYENKNTSQEKLMMQQRKDIAEVSASYEASAVKLSTQHIKIIAELSARHEAKEKDQAELIAQQLKTIQKLSATCEAKEKSQAELITPQLNTTEKLSVLCEQLKTIQKTIHHLSTKLPAPYVTEADALSDLYGTEADATTQHTTDHVGDTPDHPA